MKLLELCEKYFNTTNLYEVLQISENATEKEVKKAYHKLSLKVHPDRVKEDEKLEATEKFKVLSAVHVVLCDKDKRSLYDTSKIVDEQDYPLNETDWTGHWGLHFKKINVEDIVEYEKKYIGSDEEKQDLKIAYIAGKGDIDYIVDQIQFARSEHEPRIRGILTEMIEQGEIPAYKIFTHEPAKKRQRRHAKENREAKEADELMDSLGLGASAKSLEQLIKQRQEGRVKQMDSFLDDLAAKYGQKSNGAKKRKASTSAKAETTGKNKRKRK